MALELAEVILVVDLDRERMGLASEVVEEAREAEALGRVLGLESLVGNGGEESVFLKDQQVGVAVMVLREEVGADIENETQFNVTK